MGNCTNCYYASWKRTEAGRLHSSGDGTCTWQMPEITIPACMYYIGSMRKDKDAVSAPSGGYINRNEKVECRAWEQGDKE